MGSVYIPHVNGVSEFKHMGNRYGIGIIFRTKLQFLNVILKANQDVEYMASAKNN
jgi:hypothetical protein